MSILSFPERGHWGDAKWRGNCSGHIYKELFTSLQPSLFVDPMMGSGTSIQVAKEMGINAVGLDLHSGFNVLRDSILERVGHEADLVVSHPPYGDMIKYSTDVWKNKSAAGHPDDLSLCESVEDFHEKLHVALLNQREATKAGSYYGTIIGDQRQNGKYISFQAECIARMPASELAGVLIKAQHNCMSSSKQYGNKPKLPFILHEYILIWKKSREIRSFLNGLTVMAIQQGKRLQGTWKAIVRAVMIELGGKASLSEIYAKVENVAQERMSQNKDWQAKVRQVLQLNKEFASAERGVWQLA